MYKYIIGIDEVGRGALSGPVTVAAVAATVNLKFKIKNLKLPLRDSKKLSPKQREIWFDFIKKQKIPYAIASVSPKIIDKINISNAANLAVSRAIRKSLVKPTIVNLTSSKEIKVFLDGGLYLNGQIKNIKKQNLILTFNNRSLDKCKICIQTIIGGDTKIPAISLASIVAKISRDKYMKKLHKKYPRYDFIHNVGYGTKKHIKAIKKYGLSSVHRRTFCVIR